MLTDKELMAVVMVITESQEYLISLKSLSYR